MMRAAELVSLRRPDYEVDDDVCVAPRFEIRRLVERVIANVAAVLLWTARTRCARLTRLQRSHALPRAAGDLDANRGAPDAAYVQQRRAVRGVPHLRRVPVRVVRARASWISQLACALTQATHYAA